MATPIQVGSNNTEVLIESLEAPTTKVVIFLPGISGEAFSDRYLPLSEACREARVAIARVSAWRDVADVEQKTLAEIYVDVNTVVSLLQDQGYTSISGIGKSFGGAVMLTLPSPHVAKKVLWAPAIGVVESGGNLSENVSTRLGTFQHLTDIKVDRPFLGAIETPTLIIHGTNDVTVSISNSETIVAMLPHATLLPIEGADHSYRAKEHEDTVIVATVDFLRKT